MDIGTKKRKREYKHLYNYVNNIQYTGKINLIKSIKLNIIINTNAFNLFNLASKIQSKMNKRQMPMQSRTQPMQSRTQPMQSRTQPMQSRTQQWQKPMQKPAIIQVQKILKHKNIPKAPQN
jgi:cell envelope opacity-associated protein A